MADAQQDPVVKPLDNHVTDVDDTAVTTLDNHVTDGLTAAPAAKAADGTAKPLDNHVTGEQV
ncbi:hypothetical protein AB0E75_07790 [Streptomyces griseoviridis]|jgi:hypothetical protein|uniref:Sigma-like protein n=3 Tax=Streptomyces TaxID=1883 RepID=A0ABT9LFM6_STRGD|nr:MULTISPECIES: hypothetical protein [Streptomyces]MDP9682459.1 hypothetical protein [Streptomyces griseoviridis]GGS29261.1 hypothetical protein GCM10010238_17610 [Streptomyces niveoruber]GGS81291.1 hypothetical protein GCM10010240_13250 [Streptomyces griseoviridis]GGU19246.1 hypothetical protein GCM10010259_07010 [Streptomyces daghestanicus]GHI29669.1 hypothetical protein Sdagh_13990 [Streptomyces daghestanicus]